MTDIKSNVILNIITKGGKLALATSEKIKKTYDSISSSGGEKATKAFTQATQATDNYSKRAKGVAHATNNQTKAFSKMEQGMSGGLVPAYATVAANVFALTALFGALSRAADFQVLIAGAEELSAQTGRSLTNLAKGMQEITDGAISMKEALTSASIASSAGFDNSTIKELTQVARNASVALGRDMGDAMNRVFKGAIKAEPELLDELGIILRLQPATKKYAAELGKTVEQLTTFEKQVAVVNEVLAQGEEKFGTLGDIDTNKFAQLSATFSDLVNDVLKFVNILATPVLGFFADNIEALGGAMLIFGNSVLKAALPALQKFGAEAQKTINASVVKGQVQAAFTQAISNFETEAGATGKKLISLKRQASDVVSILITGAEDVIPPKVFDKLVDNFSSTNNELTNMTKVVKTTDKAIDNLSKTFIEGTKEYQLAADELADINVKARQYIATSHGLDSAVANQAKQVSTLNLAWQGLKTRMGQVTGAGIQGFFVGQEKGIFGVVSAFKEFNKTLLATAAGTKAVGLSTIIASNAVFTLSFAFGSLLKAIPFIGQAIVAWQLLGGAITKVLDIFRNGEAIKDTNKALEDQAKILKSATKTAERYTKSTSKLPKTFDNLNKQLTVQRNVLGELGESLNEVVENSKGFDELFGSDIDDFKDQLQETSDILMQMGFEEQLKPLEKFGDILELSEKDSLAYAKALLEIEKSTKKVTEASLAMQESVEKTFDSLFKASDKLVGLNKQLTNTQTLFVELSNTISSISTMDLSGMVGITKFVKEVSSGAFANLGLDPEVIDKFLVGSNELEAAEETLNKTYEERYTILKRLGELEVLTADASARRKEGITLGKALEEERKLNEEMAGFRVEINEADVARYNILVNLNVLNKEIITSLKGQVQAVRGIINAEIELALVTKSIELQLNNSNIGYERRIDLINKLASAEKANLEAINRLSEDAIALQDKSISQREDLLKQNINRLGETLSPQENAAESLQIQLARTANEVQRIQLLGDEIKLLNIEIKEADRLRKNYETINELLSRGADVGKATEAYKTAWTSALEEIAKKTIEGQEAQRKFVSDMIAQAGEAAASRTIGAPINTQGQLDALKASEDRLALYEEEAGFLEKTGNLWDQQADKQLTLGLIKSNDRLEEIEAQKEIAIGEKNIADAILAVSLQKQLITQLEKERAEFLSKILATELTAAKVATSTLQTRARLGATITKQQEGQIAIAKKMSDLRASSQLFEKGELDRIEKELNKALDLELEIKFKVDIEDALPALVGELNQIFADLVDHMAAATNEAEKWSASMVAATKISESFGDDSGESFGQIGLAITDFANDIIEFNNGAFVDLADSAATALTGIGSAISDAAGENEKQAKAGAYIQGVGAIIKAWNSAPFPYNAPAIAATVAGVNKLLSDIDAKSASSQASGQVARIQDSFGDNNIQGVSMQSNAFEDGIDELVDINSELFSSQRALQLAIVDLKKSFEDVAAQLFKQFKSFAKLGLEQSFGFTAGTTTTPGFFNEKSVTEDLIAAGIEFGASIEFVGDTIVGSIDDARGFLIKQVTETDSGFLGIGGGTDIDIKKKFTGLDRTSQNALSKALDNTLEVVGGLVGNLADTLGVSLKSMFAQANDVVIDSTKIDLSGKSAEDQASIISSFFSHLSNEVIAAIVPRLGQFSQVGEELTDTLARVVLEINTLDTALSTVGITLNSLVFNATSVNELFTDFSTGVSDGIDSAVSIVQDKIDFLNEALSKSGRKALFGSGKKSVASELLAEMFDVSILDKNKIRFGSDSKFKADIETLIADLKTGMDDLKNQTVDTFDEFSIELLASWNDTLLSNFKSLGEFETMFQEFSNALYSEEELADIAFQNATDTIQRGFESLTEQLTNAGQTDLLATLGSNVTTESLRAFYELAEATDAFAVSTDDATGLINTSGANLFATVVQMGSAFIVLEETIQELDTAIEDFNNNILRQIKAFGLTGKELANIQLDFEFEDAIKEATELGADIAKVEELYGLKRLDIIREYNQQIVDALDASSEGVADAILSIQRELESFDEVQFQTDKIDELWAEFRRSFDDVKSDIAGAAKAYANAIATNADVAGKTSGLTNNLADWSAELINVNDELAALDPKVLADKHFDLKDQIARLKSESSTLYSVYQTAVSDLWSAFDIDLGDNQYSTTATGDEIAALQDAIRSTKDAYNTASADLTAALIAQQELWNTLGDANIARDAYEKLQTQLEKDIAAAKKELATLDLRIIDDPAALLQQGEINVVEQIDIINQLKDAMMDRYRAEIEMVEEVEAIAVDIQQFLKDLAVGDLSPLTSMERLTEAQNQFSDNLSNVFSEDSGVATAARNNLLDSANTLLEEATGVFAIGSEYQDIYNFVTRSLENLDPQINAEIEKTDFDRLREETIAELQTLDSVLYELEQFNDQQLASEIAMLGDELIPHLDAITNKLDQLNDETWIPIKNVLTGLTGFAEGTSEVPFDQLAQVHRGEMIINPETAAEVREGGAIVTNISTDNIQDQPSNDDVVAAIRTLTEVLASSQEDILEQGERIMVQSNETTSIMPTINVSGML